MPLPGMPLCLVALAAGALRSPVVTVFPSRSHLRVSDALFFTYRIGVRIVFSYLRLEQLNLVSEMTGVT